MTSITLLQFQTLVRLEPRSAAQIVLGVWRQQRWQVLFTCPVGHRLKRPGVTVERTKQGNKATRRRPYDYKPYWKYNGKTYWKHNYPHQS